MMQGTQRSLADIYTRRGEPILAACSHLSVKCASDAVNKLIRGNQVSF